MSTPNDGGPAFPVSSRPMAGEATEWGMSLRDYIAIHASEADIDYHMTQGRVRDTGGKNHPLDEPVYIYPARELARYRYADAMLKARESGESSETGVQGLITRLDEISRDIRDDAEDADVSEVCVSILETVERIRRHLSVNQLWGRKQ